MASEYDKLSELFGTSKNKFVASASMDSLGSQVESADYMRAEIEIATRQRRLQERKIELFDQFISNL